MRTFALTGFLTYLEFTPHEFPEGGRSPVLGVILSLLAVGFLTIAFLKVSKIFLLASMTTMSVNGVMASVRLFLDSDPTLGCFAAAATLGLLLLTVSGILDYARELKRHKPAPSPQ